MGVQGRGLERTGGTLGRGMTSSAWLQRTHISTRRSRHSR